MSEEDQVPNNHMFDIFGLTPGGFEFHWQATGLHVFNEAKEMEKLLVQWGARPKPPRYPFPVGPTKGSQLLHEPVEPKAEDKSGQKPPGKAHWCNEHNCSFEEKTGKYGTFYSHGVFNVHGERIDWCNEKEK